MGEHWDDSTQSKEKIEASLVSKQEAAIRRERALAYAFSHQVGAFLILENRCQSTSFSYHLTTAFLKLFQNLYFAVEEQFKVLQPNVCRPKQPALGLELVGALDGSKAF
jgi:hypothetical protein